MAPRLLCRASDDPSIDRSPAVRGGFDLLVAEANVASAEGDLAIAGALPNPGVSLSASKSFGSLHPKIEPNAAM